MSAVIVLKKLTKFYYRSKVAAIDDLSLSIDKGEVYGFLGSNGAGKTTAIRLLLDFIRPTSGSAQIMGKDNIQNNVELKRSIGYLSGDVALPKKVTGRQLLKYLSRLQGDVDETYLATLVDRFQVELDKRTETLSKGNRQKIGLIQAFMHQPKVLILDEPTSGLDPIMQDQFYKTVEEAKAHGAAVFLSSHSFAEVERICDRVGIIRDGKLVHESPVAKVMKRLLPAWRIVLARASDVKSLEGSKALDVTACIGDSVVVKPVKAISPALAALSKFNIVSMTIEQDELEDEFMSFYDEENKV
jgi:ABC-2 type transport system ATP-binding protein